MELDRQLLLACLVGLALSAGVDDEMKNMATDIGTTLTSISSTHNHRVDWMFVIDHGGFDKDYLRLEYSKTFMQQLADHLYISPMHSQVGVITYGTTASAQIPLNVQEGNQCDFNKKVHQLTLTVGISNMRLALEKAIEQLQNNGRDSAHKVTILVTTAGWANMGDNPYETVQRAKTMGTLIVVVLVFDKAESIVAPVIVSFASDRGQASSILGAGLHQNKYAFEISAKQGLLRRLYRHFILAVENMPYLPLQVPSKHCPTCAAKEACVCDVSLYSTFHCETDTREPLMTVGCPADITVNTESQKPSAKVTWQAAKAVDYSNAMQSDILVQPQKATSVTSNPTAVNATHTADTFPIGKTVVTHKFTDGSLNSINCSFTVTVIDQESPVVSNCPTTTVVDNATSLMSTKLVYWPTVSATDNSLVTPTTKLYIDNIPQSLGQRTFPIGSSDVRLEFTDESGNFAVCRFKVTIEDHEPPVAQQCDGPNATIYTKDPQTYVDWVQPHFIDNSGKAVTVTSDQMPGIYRIGKHTITYTAEDVAGNSENCTFTFIVRGYPCADLPAPFNGALICDKSIQGVTCQAFCQNPFEFEDLPGQHKLPEKYSCLGTGLWYPSNKVPHCTVNQRAFKKQPQTYYYDGQCTDSNVNGIIKANAVQHYDGFVEGTYFQQTWGRKIAVQDFNDPVCGARAQITTAPPTTTSTTPLTTIPVTRPVTRPTAAFPRTTYNGIGVSVVRQPDGTNVIGKK